MPLKIIRRDITKIECDAIVNPTNVDLIPGGGTDLAIHRAAGHKLAEFCSKIGGCAVGAAVITPAFNLPCKYVIHTVGPVWRGGKYGEAVLLRSAYTESLRLALQNGCESVAFPLISSGLYGYPKESVLRCAQEVISSFLEDNELEVYIVVYDKESYSISRKLFLDVVSYIDSFYEVSSNSLRCESFSPLESRSSGGADIFVPERRRSESVERSVRQRLRGSKDDLCLCESYAEDSFENTLDGMLSKMDRGFAETLFYYIDKKGITDVECYKRSNVGKKTFSKIKCSKEYRPSKITAVSFAIGLHLDIEQTRHLLSTAGMCLSHSNKFDVIIEYFITSGNYKTIFDVNEVLYKFDQSLLGV